ncbi:Arginyl-tRNA--protein transferase 1, partial [Gonapodya sp. JEL0774]
WTPKKKDAEGGGADSEAEEIDDEPLKDDAEARMREVAAAIPAVDLKALRVEVSTVDAGSESRTSPELDAPLDAVSSTVTDKKPASSHPSTSKKPKGQPVLAQGLDWRGVIQGAEAPSATLKHRLEVTLVAAAFEKETFDLYCKYQRIVHRDDEDHLSEKRYTGFLVDSPLTPEDNDDETSFPGYGSFHQKYYLDGRLVAVAVLDILPKCVSSVYFLYDPELVFLSPGVYGALREIGFTLGLAKLRPDLRYYYMGFYIHSCAKMRYKAQYKPSDLLDP